MSKAMIDKLAKNVSIVKTLQRLAAKRPLTENEIKVLRAAAELKKQSDGEIK